jgi:dTDP-4-amino-4,6-dideoxygalactose transaminase
MVAVVNSVLDNSFKPVLIDNGKDKLNPTYESFINAITPKTKAIIVTHTYGVPV